MIVALKCLKKKKVGSEEILCLGNQEVKYILTKSRNKSLGAFQEMIFNKFRRSSLFVFKMIL